MKEFRVSGPPGTGKTTWLSKQVRRALEKYRPEEIYVVSFTRAAAHEVAGRGLPIPKQNIGTIHALCYRCIGNPTIAERDKGCLEEWQKAWGDTRPGWSIGRRSDRTDGLYEDGPSGDDLLAKHGLVRSTFSPAPSSMDYLSFVAKWDEHKRLTCSMDFTDLLLNAPEALPKCKVLFVDEAQDLSPLQWRVVRKWSETTEWFVVVGDDDQLLYSFAGARVSSFLIDLPSENCSILDQSYRLPSAIHAKACSWISRIGPRRLQKAYKPIREGGTVRYSSDCYDDPQELLSYLRDDIAEGKTAMVLTSCGYMLNQIIGDLRDSGIPFHNPYRVTQGKWNPLAKGVASARVLAFTELHEAMTGADDRAIEDPQLWIRFGGALKAAGCLKRGMKSRLEDLGCGRGKTDLAEVQTYFETSVLNAVQSGSIEWVMENLEGDARNKCEFPIRIMQRMGIKALSKQPQVIVGTIHSVKGGEADSVYLYPDLSYRADEEVHAGGQEAEDEITRCFYVGMTRAKNKLVLMEPAKKFAVEW